LSYGELLVCGQTPDEFLISTHCCHPSLANDNLSGVSVAVALAKRLQQAAKDHRYSYRFLFIPGTIGSITWLAQNEAKLSNIKHGIVLTNVGDSGAITYKKSRRGNAAIDLAVKQVLTESGAPHRLIDFFPYGYDERQYCSPGIDLPVGCFMRSQHGTFPEYHTSADNLDFIQPEYLADSLDKVLRVIEAVEKGTIAKESSSDSRSAADVTSKGGPAGAQRCFHNLKPKGEPQLGKYGIYEALHGDVMPALWVLNFSDGQHSLADIAARAALPFDKVARASDILITRGLLKEVEP
jgi:aminopeptidase-like protein